MMRQHRSKQRAGLRGAALVIGLIVMTALTLLTLAASNSQLMQTRIAGNRSHEKLSFQQAELALGWAEQGLLLSTTLPSACASNCDSSDWILAAGVLPARLEHQSAGWWQSLAMAFGDPRLPSLAPVSVLPVTSVPHLLIELLELEQNVPSATYTAYFRLSVAAFFPRENGYILLQSVLALPLENVDQTRMVSAVINGNCQTISINPADPDTTVPDLPCGRLGWRQLR